MLIYDGPLVSASFYHKHQYDVVTPPLYIHYCTYVHLKGAAVLRMGCMHIIQAGQPGKEGAEGRDAGVAKLWPALWGAYGWPYVSLGLLKLFGDALNFAGKFLSSHHPWTTECSIQLFTRTIKSLMGVIMCCF